MRSPVFVSANVRIITNGANSASNGLRIPPKNIKKRKRVFGSLNQSILNAESIPWQPEALKFRYILAESWTLNGASNTRLSLIETDRSGRILRCSTEHQSGSIGVPVFPFPKQQVARINKVLFNNFLVRCWGMGPIPVWQFTKEGIAYYLGCPYTILGTRIDRSSKDQAWNRLKSLLQTNAGDIAAILLGFIVVLGPEAVFSPSSIDWTVERRICK